MANKKPKVQDVVIPKEKLKELEQILSSGAAPGSKRKAMGSIAGRGCVVCGDIPNKIVTQDVGNADDGPGMRVEYYCNRCLTRLTATNGKDQTIAVRNETKSIKSMRKNV